MGCILYDYVPSPDPMHDPLRKIVQRLSWLQLSGYSCLSDSAMLADQLIAAWENDDIWDIEDDVRKWDIHEDEALVHDKYQDAYKKENSIENSEAYQNVRKKLAGRLLNRVFRLFVLYRRLKETGQLSSDIYCFDAYRFSLIPVEEVEKIVNIKKDSGIENDSDALFTMEEIKAWAYEAASDGFLAAVQNVYCIDLQRQSKNEAEMLRREILRRESLLRREALLAAEKSIVRRSSLNFTAVQKQKARMAVHSTPRRPATLKDEVVPDIVSKTTFVPKYRRPSIRVVKKPTKRQSFDFSAMNFESLKSIAHNDLSAFVAYVDNVETHADNVEAYDDNVAYIASKVPTKPLTTISKTSAAPKLVNRKTRLDQAFLGEYANPKEVAPVAQLGQALLEEYANPKEVALVTQLGQALLEKYSKFREVAPVVATPSCPYPAPHEVSCKPFEWVLPVTTVKVKKNVVVKSSILEPKPPSPKFWTTQGPRHFEQQTLPKVNVKTRRKSAPKAIFPSLQEIDFHKLESFAALAPKRPGERQVSPFAGIDLKKNDAISIEAPSWPSRPSPRRKSLNTPVAPSSETTGPTIEQPAVIDPQRNLLDNMVSACFGLLSINTSEDG